MNDAKYIAIHDDGSIVARLETREAALLMLETDVNVFQVINLNSGRMLTKHGLGMKEYLD